MYTDWLVFDELVSLTVVVATRDAKHDPPSVDARKFVQMELAGFARMDGSEPASTLPEGWTEKDWQDFQRIFSSRKLRDARRRVIENVSPLLSVHGTTAFAQAQLFESADHLLKKWPYDTLPPDDLISPLPITEQSSNEQLRRRADRIWATLILAMIQHGDIRFSNETTEQEVIGYLKRVAR